MKPTRSAGSGTMQGVPHLCTPSMVRYGECSSQQQLHMASWALHILDISSVLEAMSAMWWRFAGHPVLHKAHCWLSIYEPTGVQLLQTLFDLVVWNCGCMSSKAHSCMVFCAQFFALHISAAWARALPHCQLCVFAVKRM